MDPTRFKCIQWLVFQLMADRNNFKHLPATRKQTFCQPGQKLSHSGRLSSLYTMHKDWVFNLPYNNRYHRIPVILFIFGDSPKEWIEHKWSYYTINHMPHDDRKPQIIGDFRPTVSGRLANVAKNWKPFMETHLISVHTIYGVDWVISITDNPQKLPISATDRPPEGWNLAIVSWNFNDIWSLALPVYESYITGIKLSSLHKMVANHQF